MKKGQVTIFIVIGLVILVVLGLFLYLTNHLKQYNPAQVQQKVAETAVNSCIEAAAKEGIFLIGIHGGTIEKGPYYNLSYAVKGNRKVLISEDGMNAELKSYIEEKLPGCINQAANSTHLNITLKNSNAEVALNSKVSVTIPDAYEVKWNSATSTGTPQVDINIDLKQAYETADKMADEYVADHRFREQKLPVEILDRQNAIMVIITVPDSKIIPNADYKFAFALEK
jgi:hypothetical protein